MDEKREGLILAGMYLIAVLLSLAGLVWVIRGSVGFSIDAIFLFLVCLSMGGVFSLMLLVQLKSMGMLPSFRKKEAESAAPAAAKTAASSPEEGK